MSCKVFSSRSVAKAFRALIQLAVTIRYNYIKVNMFFYYENLSSEHHSVHK